MTVSPSIDPVRLLSSVGHDLRQPFQAMRLFLHLLQGRLSDPGQVELADRLEEALEIGAAQMDAVLTLASLAAGTARVRREHVPLGPLLDRVAGELAPRAEAEGIRLRLVRSSVTVQTDPVMLDRLLRTVIENAINHGRRGGKVVVGVCRAGGPALMVADDGPGIPADQRSRMLEPGERLDRAEGPARRGLGLGLALADHIARSLDHDLVLGGDRGLTVLLRLG